MLTKPLALELLVRHRKWLLGWQTPAGGNASSFCKFIGLLMQVVAWWSTPGPEGTVEPILLE